MPIAFAVWSALLNNFVVEVANFDGSDIGWLHTVREIPGFLAVGVIALIIFIREQVLGLVSLVLLGAASAITAWFPSFAGLLTITMLSSIGFHYYETVNQSLQLQWLNKQEAPRFLGKLLAVGSAATLVAYGLIVLGWKALDLSYNFVYLISGGVTVAIAIFCLIAYPQFEAPTPQRKHMVLRKRYWLYYALQLINLVINIVVAPFIGRAVGHFGERRVLNFEYIGLTIVFGAYGGIYFFGWGVILASILYVVDHIFFAMALAIKTYFQKIADPADIAPTAAVAFTINHIAAVFLPAGLGYIWLVSPGAVFVIATGMAFMSFLLSLLIPRNPAEGNETVLTWANSAPKAGLN